MKIAKRKLYSNKILVNRIFELFDYDHESGLLVWSQDYKRSGKAGQPVKGGISNKYLAVYVDQNREYIHRIVWVLNNGEFPEMDIDHINGNKMDNRIENLRLCTRSQNMSNRGKNKNNSSGFKGVSFCKQTGRWVAQITVDRKNKKIGRFDTKEEAADAYSKMAKEIFGEFASC